MQPHKSCEELGLRSTFKLSKRDFATSSFPFLLFIFFGFLYCLGLGFRIGLGFEVADEVTVGTKSGKFP